MTRKSSCHRLETERLILRRWEFRDREPFAAMNADPRVMEFFPALLTRQQTDETVDRLEKHFEDHGFGLFAMEFKANGAFIGLLGLNIPQYEAPFLPAVEIGWRIAAPYWRQGLCTEGAREVLAAAFGMLGLKDIVSVTVPENVASWSVMEKLGMKRDLAADFDHPKVPEGHKYRRHILYRLSKDQYH